MILITYFLQVGMDVCRGATPFEQAIKYELVFRQSTLSFKQEKQNSMWQRLHIIFLHPVVSCSTRFPHVGQARNEGHIRFSTSGRTVSLHCNSFSIMWLTQPLLSHLSERGAGPFQDFRHCQQNSNLLPVSAVQMMQCTHRLVKSCLSTYDLQLGHFNNNKKDG